MDVFVYRNNNIMKLTLHFVAFDVTKLVDTKVMKCYSFFVFFNGFYRVRLHFSVDPVRNNQRRSIMENTQVNKTIPKLYDPAFEHDNCGIGAVVNINGLRSHMTVSDALTIVERLEHRAG